MVLLYHDNISGNLSSFSILHLTETTVNETLYDMSTVLMINISDNAQLVTEILLTNIGRSFYYFFNILFHKF